MQKVFWLIPGKLAGRAGPVLEPWDLAKMRSSGITTICSTDEQCEASNITSHSLHHLKHYMPTAYPTNPSLVDKFVHLVRAAAVEVISAIQNNEAVLVHCYAGRDRTGLVLCAVLIELQNLSAQEALKKVKAVRPQALSGPGVLDVLREYEIRLKSGAF